MENVINERLQLIVKNRYVLVLFIILFLILDSLVFILPYYLNGYAIPVGWDTPWYIRNMRLIEEQGVYSLFMKTREINFFSILEYLFASMFNISFTVTAMVFPILIVLLFPLVNFQIVKRLTKSNGVSLLSMLFTIIDYNIVRMAGIFHRNVFCLLLIETAFFLVLPNLLKQQSKKTLFVFVSLATLAGISQIETFVIAMVVLSFLLLFYLKHRLVKFAKFLLLCILLPASLVTLFEAPFLSSFVGDHIAFNPATKPYYQHFIPQPGNYVLSLGMGLIPLFIVGMHVLFRNITKYDEPIFQFFFFWNSAVIAGSFLPIFNVRIPGWRFLLLLVLPPVVIFGVVKLRLGRPPFSTKKTLLSITLIVASIIPSLTGVALNQQLYYRPWVTNDSYHKLVWIGDYSQNNVCIFVLYFDKGTSTYDWAELYRNWIWAVVGTRTNVYFGDIEYLLQYQPTNFENQFLNSTSYSFWNELEDFTLNNARVYTIEEWYEPPLNETHLVEVKSDIYFMEFD